jgi:2'-5' RNA ligase
MHTRPDTLFLAIRPPDEAIEELAWTRDTLAGPGRAVTNGHLHVTMLLLDQFFERRSVLVDRVRSVLSTNMLPACRVMLDWMTGGSGSTLLMPSEPLLGLKLLQNHLADLFARAGVLAPRRWRFRPHVTLLYQRYDERCPAHGPIDPIGWRADEIVLIHSHVGSTRHETLGRWPLI